MAFYLTIAGVVLAALLSTFFSSVTYSLREFSRSRFAEYLGRHNLDHWYEPITDHINDLIFITAVGRQFSNLMLWMLTFGAFQQTALGAVLRYGCTIVVAGIMAVFFSVSVPHSAAHYAGADIVGFFAPVLNGLRIAFSPLAKITHAIDEVIRKALGAHTPGAQSQVDEEILSAVEVGEQEGVVDEHEREMIESVIEFRDTVTNHIMTPRSDIVALRIDAGTEEAKNALAQSGHSRIPVFEGTLDHIVGMLHARDLIRHIGIDAPRLDVRSMMRPALFVAETTPLRNLLDEFRQKQVHIAIVLDEYGATAGVVTIEDIIEELVGEISDEHEPSEPAKFRRIDDRTAEVDARIRTDALNKQIGTQLPEDAEYETLAGFLSSALARIPEKGAVYEHDGVRYTVLDAEPQRVKRVKIELLTRSGINA